MSKRFSRKKYPTNGVTNLHQQQHCKLSRYSGYFLKETRSTVQKFHKCSTLLKFNYLQITQQYQPIYISHKWSVPTSHIETIDIFPPTPPISSYLKKYDIGNIIQQASNILSISDQYTSQHSSILLYSIIFIKLSSP